MKKLKRNLELLLSKNYAIHLDKNRTSSTQIPIFKTQTLKFKWFNILESDLLIKLYMLNAPNF